MQIHRYHIGWRSSPCLRIAPALLVMLAACTGGDSVTQPKNSVETIPWRLGLNLHAVITTVGTPVQLEVMPVTLDGTPLSGLPPVTWITPDSMVIKVDATGKLIGSAEHDRALVIAKIESVEGNWTIADTVRVTVVNTPYAFSSFKMVLDGPTLIPANEWRNFDALLFDGSGNALVDAVGETIYPITYYTQSAPVTTWRMGNWSGGGSPKDTGQVTIRASSYIFGQVYHDSVTFRLTYPDSAPLFIFRVSYYADPSPSMMSQTDITILKGGKIAFSNLNPTENVSILFDDTANAIGGDIPKVPQGYAWQTPPAIVTFPNTGKFTYKSSLGDKGTITVVDWPVWPP